ncbi:hypothetical protein DXG03_003174 [Asterophora parasitica]|uniref:NADP-dependent oxidoreductase domain-containing protein n=1 Tax=Asterophora parasitica TaxID=117018 RepID=A0A9P7GEG8_9AGAR|nr:hypothetical protein DXG03_003174 [Asterophora parasitica]
MTTLTLVSTTRLSSGHLMPLLGFGVYQNYTTRDSVLEAFKAGYRHVDSAQAYRNEAHVGEAVRDSGIPREELFITTKIISKFHGYESTLKGVDESLARFQFDYIDLFLIHDPFAGRERRLATYKALQEAKDAGKCVLTISLLTPDSGVKHLEEIRNAGLPMPSVNQIELHPFCQQRPIVAYCRAHSIVVQAYCPILRGKLDDATIAAIATKYGRDPAQILLRWSLQKGFVPLPKSANPTRIHSNTHLYDFELAEEDVAALDALDEGKDGALSWNPVDAMEFVLLAWLLDPRFVSASTASATPSSMDARSAPIDWVLLPPCEFELEIVSASRNNSIHVILQGSQQLQNCKALRDI